MADGDDAASADHPPFRLRLSGVGKRYGPPGGSIADGVWALREVSFVLPPSTVMGVIGLPGSGRSSLIRIVGRVSRQTEGVVEGHGPSVALDDLVKRVESDLTARQTLGSRRPRGPLPGGVPAKVSYQHLNEAAAESGVEALLRRRLSDWPRSALSGFLHAVALKTSPGVLAADGALLPPAAADRGRALARLMELVSEGTSILYAPRSLDEVSRFCDQVLWLDRGRVRAIGEPDELLAAFRAATTPARPVVKVEPERPPSSNISVSVTDGDAPRRSFTRGEFIQIDILISAAERTTGSVGLAIDLAMERTLIARSAHPSRLQLSADHQLQCHAGIDSRLLEDGLHRVVVRVQVTDDEHGPRAVQEIQVKFFVVPDGGAAPPRFPFATIQWCRAAPPVSASSEPS